MTAVQVNGRRFVPGSTAFKLLVALTGNCDGSLRNNDTNMEYLSTDSVPAGTYTVVPLLAGATQRCVLACKGVQQLQSYAPKLHAGLQMRGLTCTLHTR
jgi:hypothetical protein